MLLGILKVSWEKGSNCQGHYSQTACGLREIETLRADRLPEHGACTQRGMCGPGKSARAWPADCRLQAGVEAEAGDAVESGQLRGSRAIKVFRS